MNAARRAVRAYILSFSFYLMCMYVVETGYMVNECASSVSGYVLYVHPPFFVCAYVCVKGVFGKRFLT